MLTPPFKRSSGGLAALGAGTVPPGSRPGLAPLCCDDHAAPDAPPDEAPVAQRTRLQQLDPHLHCSVLGTCLSTGELRKLMARHLAVKDMSDLDVHHTAVGLAAQGGDVSKALHKALDQRHAGAVRSFAAARDDAGLQAAWDQAWQQGEIPGAYWALLTHKGVTGELRQMAFGAVHMLSHLMGSANRQEIRRFVALERESTELNDKLAREHARRQELMQERDQLAAQVLSQALAHEAALANLRAERAEATHAAQDLDLIALHTQRREQAERHAQDAQQEVQSLQRQLERLQFHAQAMAEELAAAEAELQALGNVEPQAPPSRALAGFKLLYVGGRPSSMPAIRAFVARHGGELLHHDGGIETRKGLLAAQLPKADLVVFPVDCIDHDSAQNLKRLCERHQREFVVLRSASLGSFAAALRRRGQPAADGSDPKFCLRHG